MHRLRIPYVQQAAVDREQGPQELYAALTVSNKALVRFTTAEGAGMHTEALARTLYDQRMFDWLDQTLSVGG